MTRLNNSIRNQIIKNAIEQSGVNTRNADLIERRANLAEAIRIRAIGGEEADADRESKIAKIKACVEKHSHNSIRVNIHEYNINGSIRVNFAGRSIDLDYTGKENAPYHDVFKYSGNNHYNNRLALTNDDPLLIEYDVIQEVQKQVNTLRETIETETRAIVYSVTTIKKLLEIWPESRELIPNVNKPATGTGLVVNTTNLNAAIGLPKEEK